MSFDGDSGLIYFCRASCFQYSKGSAHFKDEEGESSPGEVTEFQVELDSKLFLLAWQDVSAEVAC